MNNKNICTDNVRTNKNERLEIRINGNLKRTVNLFCKENNIDRTYFITTLILSFFKKRNIKTYKIKRTWQNIEDMPTNPEIEYNYGNNNNIT